MVARRKISTEQNSNFMQCVSAWNYSMIKSMTIGEEKIYGKNRDKNILEFCDVR